MPQSPHPLSGIVKDINDSTVVEGVTVTAFDKTSGGTTTDTTDSNGAYVVDLANLKNTLGREVTLTPCPKVLSFVAVSEAYTVSQPYFVQDINDGSNTIFIYPPFY